MKLYPTIVSIILYTMAMCLQAATPLDNFLNGLQTLQANFIQVVTSANRHNSQVSKGKFYLKRPNLFRWDYSDPKGQQVVADGSRIWLYDPELLQVSHQAQEDALRGSPVQLLSGKEPITRHFKVINVGIYKNIHWLKLIPKSENSEIVRIDLGFRDEYLEQFKMVDVLGQTTQFAFNRVKRNLQLPNRFFRFRTPPGADVLHN